MTSNLPVVQVWKLGFGEATGNNSNVSTSGLEMSTGATKTNRSAPMTEESKASAAAVGESDGEGDEILENYERLD